MGTTKFIIGGIAVAVVIIAAAAVKEKDRVVKFWNDNFVTQEKTKEASTTGED